MWGHVCVCAVWLPQGLPCPLASMEGPQAFAQSWCERPHVDMLNQKGRRKQETRVPPSPFPDTQLPPTHSRTMSC